MSIFKKVLIFVQKKRLQKLEFVSLLFNIYQPIGAFALVFEFSRYDADNNI